MDIPYTKYVIMRKAFFITLICLCVGVLAQESLSYQKPPREILELVDVSLAPSVLLDNPKENMVLLYRNPYKSIAELSKEELRLGGLRIDPATHIGSRVTYYNNIEIKDITETDGKIQQVSGLPESPLLSNFNWSPDQQKMARIQGLRSRARPG